MAIADKLQSILDSKASIKQALINKGYSAEQVGDIFSQYGYLIENIPSGGGGEIEAALSNAKYDYVKDYLLDMIAESYDITKNWTDYSQSEGSDIWFVPQIEGQTVIYSFKGCKRLLFVEFKEKVRCNYPWNNFANCTRLIFADLSNLDISGNNTEIFLNDTSLLKCKFNGSKVSSNPKTFFGCTNLEEVEIVESGKMAYISSMFNGCYSLKKIYGEPIDFSLIESTSGFSLAFTNCSSLVEVRFKENTLSIGGLNLSPCTSLSHDSLLSAINACAEVSSTQTLTLGATNLAKLTDEEKAIATNKGWTLA